MVWKSSTHRLSIVLEQSLAVKHQPDLQSWDLGICVESSLHL